MTCLYCGTPLPAGAMFCVECGRPVRSAHLPPAEPRDTAVIEPLEGEPLEPGSPEARAPEAHSEGADGRTGGARNPGESPDPDTNAPLSAVEPEDAPRVPGQSYVLQFSTGEVVTVTGTGLIGRNPVPQPTEYFDQLVTIVDPARSVSKTHLEFGQERGVLWVCDRFSGNGTVIVVPGQAPRRCEPGRRVHVARGSRVDIAEQYFIVS